MGKQMLPLRWKEKRKMKCKKLVSLFLSLLLATALAVPA